MKAFAGDMHPGDVYLINDPYAGGTHFPDVRVIRPIFVDNEIIAYSQANGHWADVGGSVPGSFDISAKQHFGEGMRITPVRVWSKGTYLQDVANLIASNTRAPGDIIGDMHAQSQATAVAEREILRLVDKYGKDAIVTAFKEGQDYVEYFTRKRISELPDGAWETEDYLDQDPSAGEGLIPVKMKMTIAGDTVHYDFTGSHGPIGTVYNSAFGTTFSGIVSGMKSFFPDVPLNSGFYRAIETTMPVDTIVNARWPVAVTGGVMVFERIMNSIFELWSRLMPERAMACAFNIEYLQIGGQDRRLPGNPFFMCYDYMAGGWGGRNGKDGSSVTSSPFGAGLQVQPIEGQERLAPISHVEYDLLQDSGGPGKHRGGLGLRKTGVLTDAGPTIISYICDRERSIAWGLEGGLPSYPHGLWLTRNGDNQAQFLGAMFSNVELNPGDTFTRPSAGGGGFGDPLDRDQLEVCEDVADEYVSVARAATDYGVVIKVIDEDMAEYQVDQAATERERARIRAERKGWLRQDPEDVARRYRAGELDIFDLVRQYGVIVHWGTGELLPNTTKTYREMLARRAEAYWD
jgi:N-methylhydantoinase B